MSTMMQAGVVTGILFGILLIIIILKVTKTDGSIKCKYDERQLIARGNAFKYSYFTLAGAMALYALLTEVFEFHLMTAGAAIITGIVLSACVNIGYSIAHDAYFSLNESRPRLLVAFAALAVLNGVAGVRSLMEGDVITDGMLNIRIANLLCAVMFLVVFLLLLWKHHADKAVQE